MKRFIYSPGDLAPATGIYEELNLSHRPTGQTIRVDEGDLLPENGYGYILIR
jgi:hypothetical protein